MRNKFTTNPLRFGGCLLKLHDRLSMFSQPNSIAIVGCGWLGTPLATTLIGRGYRVVATRSTPDRVAELQSQGIDTVRLTLTSTLEIESSDRLKGIAIAVILLPPGTRRGEAGRFPDRIANLISGLEEAEIARVIFSSSTSVYPNNNVEVDETENIVPETTSGQALFEAEKKIMEAPILATIVRFAGLCGPGREPGRLLAGRDQVPGGHHPVNLIHQQDAIELLVSLIRNPRWGQIFNACAPCHPRKQDLYRKAARSMDLVPPIFIPGTTRFKIVRADKVCQQLGFVYCYPDPSNWHW